GAMGSTFGARFARAGAEVVLFDVDEAHIAAIAAEGLSVATPTGEIRVRLPATTDASAIGPADMAVGFVGSKAPREAAATLASVLPANGFALTLQNGIGNIEALVGALGGGRVVGGTTYNSAARLGPGRVLHSNIGETTIGELAGSPSERVAAIADL